MNDFSLNLLSAFDALQRHRHVGKAAAELGLSQPTVSYLLKQLREMLGDALFVKVRHGMEPTPRALELIPVVQSVLADIRERILTAPGFEPSTVQRKFTLAVSDIGEMVFLPRLLQRLALEAPGIDVRTVSIAPRDLMAALQRSEVDLAAGYFPDLQGTDIFQQRLFTHRFVCLVRSNHPAVSGRFTKKQFRELPHAVVQAEGRSQEIVEQVLKNYGVQRREQFHSPHFLSIPMVIATTDLVVTVPAAVAELFVRLADVKTLEPPYAMPSFDLKQYWHRSQLNDPGNRWLRAMFLELFGDGGKQ